MFRWILKVLLKVFIAAVVLRVAVLAVGAYVATDKGDVISPGLIMEMRDTGLEAIETVTRLISR